MRPSQAVLLRGNAKRRPPDRQTLAAGSSASTIRTTLSALQCLHWLKLLDWSIPPVWWRLSTAADRLALRAPLPLAAFSELGLSLTSTDCNDIM